MSKKIVVVGSGNAAMCAGIAAADEGAVFGRRAGHHAVRI